MFFLVFFLLTLSSQSCHSIRILGIFPYTGESHFYVFRPLLAELAHRGHRVTVVSHFPLTTPIDNYTDISLRGTLPIFREVLDITDFVDTSVFSHYVKSVRSAMLLSRFAVTMCETMMNDFRVQDIQRGQYDLLLIEHFNSDCGMGLAHKLGVPFVGISAHVPMPYSASRMGLTDGSFYVQNHFLSRSSTLYERVEAFILNAFHKYAYSHWTQAKEHQILTQHYGEGLPDLESIAKKTSVSLVYTHHVFNGVFSTPPNVVEIGGLHIQAERELEPELKKFLDDAQEGVVVFSMGSMLKETTWPADKLKAFRDAFAEIPQKVLWKWKNDTIEGLTENVKVVKWLPQMDVLRHRNVKVFLAHAGLLGMTEALYAGVPVVAIPLYGDQFNNAGKAVDAGFGVLLNFNHVTKNTIVRALGEALEPSVLQKAKRLSEIWKDRPQTAMDTAIYWIEYAYRNGGQYLNDPEKCTCFFKMMLFDVVGVLATIIVIIIYLLYKISSSLRGFLLPKEKSD